MSAALASPYRSSIPSLTGEAALFAARAVRARRSGPSSTPVVPAVTSNVEGDWPIMRAAPIPAQEQNRGSSKASMPLRRAEDFAWIIPGLPGQVKWALGPSSGYRIHAELPVVDSEDRQAVHEAAWRARALDLLAKEPL